MPFDKSVIRKGAFLHGGTHAATTAPASPPGMSLSPAQLAEAKQLQRQLQDQLNEFRWQRQLRKSNERLDWMY